MNYQHNCAWQHANQIWSITHRVINIKIKGTRTISDNNQRYLIRFCSLLPRICEKTKANYNMSSSSDARINQKFHKVLYKNFITTNMEHLIFAWFFFNISILWTRNPKIVIWLIKIDQLIDEKNASCKWSSVISLTNSSHTTYLVVLNCLYVICLWVAHLTGFYYMVLTVNMHAN